MITENALFNIGYNLLKECTYSLPKDKENAIKEAYEKESLEHSKFNLQILLEHLEESRCGKFSLCGDSGYPTFLIRVGKNCKVENGLQGIKRALRESVKKATMDYCFRSSMIHPFTGNNPGTNVTSYTPILEFLTEQEDLDGIELNAAFTGGATEIFGTAYKTILFADGLKGIKKFIVDSLILANETGGACPPNILGIGIGGTSVIASKLARLAAILRPIGTRHPEKDMAALEDELFHALNQLDMGPLAMGGKTTVLDVHVEYAYTHLIGIPVAIYLQCPAARINSTLIDPAGNAVKIDYPKWEKWFERSENND